jgi:hypothetical protein
VVLFVGRARSYSCGELHRINDGIMTSGAEYPEAAAIVGICSYDLSDGVGSLRMLANYPTTPRSVDDW